MASNIAGSIIKMNYGGSIILGGDNIGAIESQFLINKRKLLVLQDGIDLMQIFEKAFS